MVEHVEPNVAKRGNAERGVGLEADGMYEKAKEASLFLKALSHQTRLLILCYLIEGEKSVSELEALLSRRQASVSQQLARLRLEGFIVPRREGKAVYYSLADERVKTMIGTIHSLFCDTSEDP